MQQCIGGGEGRQQWYLGEQGWQGGQGWRGEQGQP